MDKKYIVITRVVLCLNIIFSIILLALNESYQHDTVRQQSHGAVLNQLSSVITYTDMLCYYMYSVTVKYVLTF